MVKIMCKRNIEVLVKKMIEDKKLIDNHDESEKSILGLVQFNSRSKGLAAILDYSGNYSLNEVYFDEEDNMLHLSMCSIGGILKGTPTEESIRKYNNDCIFDGGKIKCIYWHDSSVLCI